MNSDMNFKEKLDSEIGDMPLKTQMIDKAIATGRARQTRRKLAARAGYLAAVAATALVFVSFLGHAPKAPTLGPTQAECTQAGGTATAAVSSASPTAPAEIGERLHKDIVDKSGLNELHIDTTVPSYKDKTFPAAEISPQKFSQAQANTIIKALVGDSFFYNATTMTMSQINEQIAFYTQKLSQATDQNKKDLFQGFIDQYTAMLKNAPANDAAIPPASRIFKKVKIKGAADKEEIVGKFKKGDQVFTLFIDNYDNTGEQSVVDMDAVGGMSRSIIGRAADATPDQDPGIPYDQAEAQAKKIAGDMGTGLTLADAFLGREDSMDRQGPATTKYFYSFDFTRAVNGSVTQYDETYLSASGTEEENNKPNAKQPWPYELLRISIDDQGVFGVNWTGPSKVDSVLNENIPTMTFEQTLARFEESVFEKNWGIQTFRASHGNNGKAVVHVDRITLGLARVQSGNKYMLLPAWDFYGYVEYLKLDGKPFPEYKNDDSAYFSQSLTSLLTINATDGSIINRSLGQQ